MTLLVIGICVCAFVAGMCCGIELEASHNKAMKDLGDMVSSMKDKESGV